MAARKFNGTSCSCPLRCCNKISEAERKKLFDGFWSTGAFNTQNSYICGCIKILEPKRRYTKTPSTSRRSYSRVYYLNKGALSVRVRKLVFLRTFGISNGGVDRALKAKIDRNGSPPVDGRGQHEPANKTTDDDLARVKQHIEEFPKYQSHYSRQSNPNRQYLSPDLNVSKMFQMYVEKCKNAGFKCVSEWVYRSV